jgi:hypothetical protein
LYWTAPDLGLALELHNLQLAHGFTNTPIWRPREENIRVDYLSHVAKIRHQGYRIPAELLRDIDAAWSQQTVGRFASPANAQPLSASFTGWFCSHYGR